MTSELANNPKRWWILGFVALAVLMVMIDGTIVLVAMPSMQADVGLSDADRQWLITAYALAFGSLLLIGGRIADRMGRRNALLIGLIGFAIASAVGGATSSGPVLIAARAAQGVFAALLSPAGLSIITTTFTGDPKERAKAFGVFSGVAGGGVALGLLLGGVLTETLSWRWCMYVNVPIAVIAGIGVVLVLPVLAGHKEGRLDIAGALTSCLGMVAFVYGFSWGGEHGWTTTAVVMVLVGLVLLGAFLVLQTTVPYPLIPLRVLADRNRAGALIAVTFITVAQLSIGLYATYQMQTIMQFSPLTTGLAILPLVASVLVGSVYLAPRVLPRRPARVLIVPGMLLTAGALFIFTRMTPDTSFVAGLLPAEMLLGLGIGLTLSPATNTATSKIAEKDAGAVSASVGATQQVGAALGTAFANAVSTSAAAAYLAAAPGAPVASATIHGNATAAGWTIGIILAAALAVWLLVNARPQDLRSEEDELLML
ncbi:MFS transporter [Pseudonocardia sp. TRM90224]|uniref:MFS transporter n=1 Tax=Pseudonocardia sp. TRM90224 TaxID=2812678 RepID=UPI001E499898|nr:MFS transporter [Pseudonocardia sp. TRM90224]